MTYLKNKIFDASLLLISSVGVLSAQQTQKMNVLFIISDDLRPTLGCYGDTKAITPNIDKLGDRSMIFSNAYCQQAVCNPSRASMITGLRPDQIRVTDLETNYREFAPNVLTLPQVMHSNGYTSISIGKVLHGQKNTQDDASWDRAPFMNVIPTTDEYVIPENKLVASKEGKSTATECVDVEDTAYDDGKITEEAIKQLHELKQSQSPFFLAVGLRKPHIPYCAPKKYWDLYKGIDFSKIEQPGRPAGAPDIAFNNNEEVKIYSDIPKDIPIPQAKQEELRHGYYACVSYFDAQVGKILATLKELGFDKNTMIIIWGDNGYHLGEQTLWCKSNNFELDTRVPLIMSVPGITTVRQTSKSIVEVVDIFPTILYVCGIKSEIPLAGKSLVSILKDRSVSVKNEAYSQFIRPYSALRTRKPTHMGYTVRTAQWRCTAWFNLSTNTIESSELYKLVEAGEVERKNLAGDKKYAKVEAELTAKLIAYKNKQYTE